MPVSSVAQRFPLGTGADDEKCQLSTKYATVSEASSSTSTASASSEHAGAITAPSVTPTADGSAIEILFGNNTGDNNGGEAWGVAGPLGLDWSIATGASSSGNRSAGMALRVLTGEQGASTGAFRITDLTGQSGNTSNAAITAAITPASTGGAGSPGSPIALPKYADLGAKQRSTTLPTGVIEMGARLYVPQIGRFLQVDPVYGGSANVYDYALQDPVNVLDLDGRRAKCHRTRTCHRRVMPPAGTNRQAMCRTLSVVGVILPGVRVIQVIGRGIGIIGVVQCR